MTFRRLNGPASRNNRTRVATPRAGFPARRAPTAEFGCWRARSQNITNENGSHLPPVRNSASVYRATISSADWHSCGKMGCWPTRRNQYAAFPESGSWRCRMACQKLPSGVSMAWAISWHSSRHEKYSHKPANAAWGENAWGNKLAALACFSTRTGLGEEQFPETSGISRSPF